MADDEAAMLGAIAGGDDAARSVYADWLEQHGRRACADFLRVQELRAAAPPGSREDTDATLRLRALAEDTDVAWRMQIARGRVAGCAAAGCAMDWCRLARTEHAHVRVCATCDGKVAYHGPGVARSNLPRHVADATHAVAHWTVEHLADLPADAPWEVHALAVATGAEAHAVSDARRPPVIDALRACPLDLVLDLVDPGGRWRFGPGGALDHDWAARADDAGLAPERRSIAHHEFETSFLVASWHPGDRDAALHVAWSYEDDDPRISGPRGTVGRWLARIVEAHLLEPDPDIARDDRLAAALRDTITRAAALREALHARRTAHAAAIEAGIGTPGVDDDEAMQRWEVASAEAARVATMPGVWHRLVDPADE